ncbi:MAG: pantetheine-phosphate adenylyltransferase [Clostridiales Family XIII bacterium]|nr:pantetheine-phosphate adenylyltransferase [Clostridiales Family XIII bacterium]
MRKMLYAGTFDPITNGHLDIIKRGAKRCDQLIVGVLNNSAKRPFYTAEERAEMIALATDELDNVVIDTFEGLLADYVKANDVDVVIRGLRASMDFEYELVMAQMNARLYGDCVETIFLMTDPANSFVSSSIVKEVFGFGGDVSGLVPPRVLDYMQKRQQD